MLRWLLAGALALCACGDDESTKDDGSGGGGSGGQGGSGGEGKPVVDIVTSMGTMVVQLEPELMPNTTENFLTYVNEGFYSGTLIHRVISDFVIQGGGFTTGLTPKTPTHPPIGLEGSDELLHVYGAISMARTDDPNSATSQFFLVNGMNGAPSLDGSYAAFGVMLEGFPILDAISAVQTHSVGANADVPVDEVTVMSITQR
jgi:cyclophilin family peptidyl-prolyl cis-trans isomerase